MKTMCIIPDILVWLATLLLGMAGDAEVEGCCLLATNQMLAIKIPLQSKSLVWQLLKNILY